MWKPLRDREKDPAKCYIYHRSDFGKYRWEALGPRELELNSLRRVGWFLTWAEAMDWVREWFAT